MTKCRTFAVLILSAVCASAGAQTRPAASTRPRTRPAGTPLTAVVKELTGTAQRMTPAARAGARPRWVALKVGDRLNEGNVIRTGFRTRVVLAFADNSVIVVDSATKIGIGQFRKVGKVTATRLGLKYGS
ncbi:MAG: FecR family protein, partial [Planctomycetota bacterium]